MEREILKGFVREHEVKGYVMITCPVCQSTHKMSRKKKGKRGVGKDNYKVPEHEPRKNGLSKNGNESCSGTGQLVTF